MAQAELKPFIGNEEELINEEEAAKGTQPVENVIPLDPEPPTEYTSVAEFSDSQDKAQQQGPVPLPIIMKKSCKNM